MADLPAPCEHPAGLTGRVGREVVVVHVVLFGDRAQVVQALAFTRRSQGYHGKRLRLAAGEQSAPVSPRQVANFRREVSQVRERAPVRPATVLEDCGAYRFRLKRVERGLEITLFVLFTQRFL